ncbi:DUF2971 domain-containing protein [Sneathiella sp.]|uniref:DUF2971 domain-containing protein n=1 Tax=Sneathiella sp. TaxID=1964365 RepID=UPI00262970F9|nr:DUF2971 domain-containing protein [Sneathiella sp.]MDF2368288.1 DUF2971 domain-containing protein [Sneathiella sp.]
MSNSIYRFRSIDKILSTEDLNGTNQTKEIPITGYDELRKQQIYFSPLNSLNDPMEGYRDIYWDGDEIVWRNFIKHYLLCLEHIYGSFCIGGKDFPLSSTDILVFQKYSDLPTDEYKHLFDEILSRFFSNENAKLYPKRLAERQISIKRNELLSYLRSIHTYALFCIANVYQKHGMVEHKPSIEEFDPQSLIFTEEFFVAANQFAMENTDKSAAIEEIYAAQTIVYEEVCLIHKYNSHNFRANQDFLLLRFPIEYLKQIEQLLYPNNYVACFSEECTNSSMWAHYAENHSGICLQFKTDTNFNINLYTITSTGGHKKGDEIISTDIYGNRKYRLSKVQYDAKHPEIDFFRSLGQLPIPHLNEVWFYDENGKCSVCANGIVSENEEWRRQYWERHQEGLITKSSDWQYEKEYRAILTTFVIDGEKSSKNTTYNFETLEGIIFGMNTKTEHKLAIIKIIDEKCRENSREDFKFYQAYYSQSTGKIEKKELSFLTPKHNR